MSSINRSLLKRYSMNSTNLLLSALTALFLLGLVYLHTNYQLNSDTPQPRTSAAAYNTDNLLALIHAQNETIYALEKHLKATHLDQSHVAEDYAKLTEMSAEVKRLPVAQEHTTEPKGDRCPLESHAFTYPRSAMEVECENRYGMDLVRQWSSRKEVWCTPQSADGDTASELTCYPYHQAHKKLDGRGPDMFCEARNFVVDFSKVRGEHSRDRKPPLGSQYLSFEKGSLSAECATTASYRSGLFMPHHALQVLLPGTVCCVGNRPH